MDLHWRGFLRHGSLERLIIEIELPVGSVWTPIVQSMPIMILMNPVLIIFLVLNSMVDCKCFVAQNLFPGGCRHSRLCCNFWVVADVHSFARIFLAQPTNIHGFVYIYRTVVDVHGYMEHFIGWLPIPQNNIMGETRNEKHIHSDFKQNYFLNVESVDFS